MSLDKPILRKCRVCGRKKPLYSEFYRDRGTWAWRCKSCTKQYVATWQSNNRERRRATSRRYTASGARKYAPNESSPKTRARAALNYAVRAGRIEREPCLFCDNPDTQAHHHDYAQPLSVTWLCTVHHGLAHRSPPWR